MVSSVERNEKGYKMSGLPEEKRLRSMGVAWFVSHAYYDHVDQSHNNWQRTNTVTMRKSFYVSTTEHHAEWLREVLDMRPAGLSRNTIGLGATQIKDMARRTLAKMA